MRSSVKGGVKARRYISAPPPIARCLTHVLVHPHVVGARVGARVRPLRPGLGCRGLADTAALGFAVAVALGLAGGSFAMAGSGLGLRGEDHHSGGREGP